jgi:flagellar assembly protein FliH
MSSLPRPWRAPSQPESVARVLPALTDRAPADDQVADDLPPVERLVQDARREGFEEGRAAGLAEAKTSLDAARRERLDLLAAELSRAACNAASMREQVVAEVGRDVAGLAVDLAEVLLEHEMEGHRVLCDRIVQALALAPRGPDLVVRISPDAGLSDEEVRAMADSEGVDVVRDPSIDPTGCLVTVGSCTVDAQVSSALDRVRRQLAETR